ncbi:MAG: agmatinase [Rhodospirillales bacterium RIFCSPLOWO2_12_FULL_58_28]|nr:MAG: agmatinase [Rhodospirillales bacterium RIFCSPLOWO2_02_FULL_58_16]OHC77413.1 MAG: agmatinase [Rhodospirillales bacterium RIFCSPLOWO2_12_FULL_58_28]
MNFLPPENGFLGLRDEDAKAAEGKPGVTVVPFGLEGSVSYGGGTARGPQAIIRASHQVELFDEELWREPCREFRPATMAPFPLAEGIRPALAQLEGIIEGILADNQFPLVLGGEHSLTAGAIRPFAERHDDLVILQFDAHADLRDGYEGEPYSHAAAMRRCLDNPGLSLVAVGIRNISAGEASYLDENRRRINTWWAKDRREWNVQEIISSLAGRPVYLTFDLDGFDSSLMPATGTPEPGGLLWDDVLPIIRGVCRTANVVGADICELAPIDGLHSCDFLAAKLAYKILTYRFAG